MKRLLFLAISAISIASIQAQPVAQDARFISTRATFHGALGNLVTGGNPPYHYRLDQALTNNIEVMVLPNGNFIGTVPLRIVGRTAIPPAGKEQFQYTAIDQNNDESNPATVTIQFGQEKG